MVVVVVFVVVVVVVVVLRPSPAAAFLVWQVFPGQLAAVREWFTWYKAVDGGGNRIEGKEPNVFGFGGEPLDVDGALGVIDEAHRSWQALVLRKVSAGTLSLC